ncbi:MAG: ABC transporter ATP-binding protein [Armatimonadota bacterium]|nr:ABC transporter ATP-binding protein [Armatimonadota bacterium]MDR7484770.1 ABC transporter ATP-binding protein [Armatimonadota bacterium]MDR7531885.1 ABC transporter ATP-binding protein [Armatimonadota bacterium]MDR7534770.1 ABC transporter ATP-binding protein [Armatimonadota bacterium]
MLDVRGLHVRYGAFHVVHGVSLTVGAGEIVAVLGPNGAGKTTTLRAIHGIVPIASGEVTYAGRRLDGASPAVRVRLGLCLVPEGRELFPLMSVEEHLELGFVPGRGRRLAEARDEVYALFPRLAERRRQTAGSLSGGEQQMLAIGRALMATPALLMLDEPSLGLAPRVVAQVYETLEALNRRGLTLVIVEQHVHEALALAHHAYIMTGGQVTLHGSAAEVRDRPELRASYLAV